MLNYRALSTLGQTSTRNALINFFKKIPKNSVAALPDHTGFSIKYLKYLFPFID